MAQESKIFWLAAVLGLLAAGLVAPHRGTAADLAVVVGAGLSLLNYAWLRRGVAAILHLAADGEATASVRGGAMRFALRLGLLLGCLCAIFISHLLPMIWVVAGLFAVPAATLMVAVAELVRLARHA